MSLRALLYSLLVIGIIGTVIGTVVTLKDISTDETADTFSDGVATLTLFLVAAYSFIALRFEK